MWKILDTVRKFFDYNRFAVLGILGASAIGGCQFLESTTIGPVTGKKVSYVQLKGEEQVMIAKFTTAYNDLNAKEEKKQAIMAAVGSFAQSVPTPWGGLITTGLGIIALGSTADSVRKNGILTQYKQRNQDLALAAGITTAEPDKTVVIPGGTTTVVTPKP